MAERRAAVSVHHTATSEGTWDGSAHEARLRTDESAAYYRRAYAWGPDPDKDEDTKAAWRFIHHEIGEDGDIGPANMRACSSGIGTLNGSRVGTTIPDADRAGVHRHLAAHMMDAEMEPPELMRALPAEGYERRAFPLQEVRVSHGDDGAPRIEWYAAVFDTLSEDLGGFRERVFRRAFSKTLREADVRALFNHDPNYVLGRNRAATLELRVDTRGLRAVVTPPDTQWAKDLLVSVARGDISAGSFGFRVLDEKWSEDAELGIVREVREVQLFDVSLVTYPAYPATEGVALRSALTGVGGLDIDGDLIHPLLRARAGVPPTPEEMGRFQGALDRLRSALPEPPDPPTPPAGAVEEDGHSEQLALHLRHRSMELELLRLRGG